MQIIPYFLAEKFAVSISQYPVLCLITVGFCSYCNSSSLILTSCHNIFNSSSPNGTVACSGLLNSITTIAHIFPSSFTKAADVNQISTRVPYLASRWVRHGSSFWTRLNRYISTIASVRSSLGIRSDALIVSASASLQPYALTAPWFQAMMWPFRSCTVIASWASRTATARRSLSLA